MLAEWWAMGPHPTDMNSHPQVKSVRCMNKPCPGSTETSTTSMPWHQHTGGRYSDALKTVFGDSAPVIHQIAVWALLGAAGVQEAIYSLLMMASDFVAASANIETLDAGAEGMPIARQRIDNAGLEQVMSNSFGFGGTNATLIFRRFHG